jgi:predicted transcriptional regulator
MNTRIESLFKTSKKQRYILIINQLKKYPNGLTAREIMKKLWFKERNSVAPRITELKAKGKVKENGTKYDKTTQRKVTVYCLEKGA